MKLHFPVKLHLWLLTLTIVCTLPLAQAQQIPEIAGQWIFNQDLSDVTDKRVEVALKASGIKVKRRWFSSDKEVYKGGPVEQELYDHLSYDYTLSIELNEPEFMFVYEEGFRRPVYTDNRRRSVSLNTIDDIDDFSFAHWSEGKLMVEARPRDGGFVNETYALINEGKQLQVELFIKPRSFDIPIEITRVFDRAPSPAP